MVVYTAHKHALTQCLHSLSLLTGGFGAKVTADMVKSKENMVLLMDMHRKLDFNLSKKRNTSTSRLT